MSGKFNKVSKKVKKGNKENKNKKAHGKKQNPLITSAKNKKALKKKNKKNLKEILPESKNESKDLLESSQEEEETKVVIETKKRKAEETESDNEVEEDPIEFEAESDEEKDSEEEDEEEADMPQSGAVTHEKANKMKKTFDESETHQANNNKQSFGNKSSEASQQSTRIFIGGLSKNTTVESVKDFFESRQMKLKDVHLPMLNDVIKGFGFAEFESQDMANKAVSLAGEMLDGNEINISFAKPKKTFGSDGGNSNETNILIIKGLSPTTTNEDLKKHFGDTPDIRLICHPDGACKGYGFIEFTSMEAARTAKARKANSLGSGVFIDFAAPRGENRFDRGNFHDRGRGGFRRGGDGFRGDDRRGSFRGNRGFNRSFGGDRGDRGGHFGNKPRGGFGRGDRGRFRGRESGGDRFRGKHIQFDQD